MAIDFPDSPSVNDTFAVGGRTYTWNGTQWKRVDAEVASVSPSLTVTGDFTADTDTLVVDSTNNRVGIGTSTPSQTLDVVGKLDVSDDVDIGGGDWGFRLGVTSTDDEVAQFASTSPTAKLRMFSQDTPNLYLATADIDLDIPSFDPLLGESAEPTLTVKVANTTAVRVKKVGSTFDTSLLNGKVGIGTTSPARPLHVYDPTLDLPLRVESGDSRAGIEFFDNATTVNLDIGAVGNSLRMRTNGSDRMTIDLSGNVGINDTTPSYRLDVNGDINAQGYARSKGKKLGMALIYEGSLSGTTSTFLGTFSADWLNYRIIVDPSQNGNGGWTFFRFVDSSNNSIQSGYYSGYFINGSYSTQAGQGGAVAIYSEYYAYGGMIMDITLPYQGDNPSFHVSASGHNVNGNNAYSLFAAGYCATTSDITGFQFYNGAPYGSVKVYGY